MIRPSESLCRPSSFVQPSLRGDSKQPTGQRGLESLEPRVLLSADAEILKVAVEEPIDTHPHVLFAPDTPPEVYQPYFDAEEENDAQFAAYTYTDGNRWSSTSSSGGGLAQGESTVITWSIVPDGTSIAGYNGEPTADSDLFAWLGGIYGSNGASTDAADQPWFYLFDEMFDRWGELTGLSYQYVNEQTISDWTGTGNNPNIAGGSPGVRGDVRIAAHFIDGNSNVLAYNYFPNVGDMVLDSGDNFFNNTTNDSIRMRNVLAHEHGHGLGLPHVEPVNGTKLMEPFASTSFLGPQFDDILAVNRGYGDNLEEGSGNDTSGNATALGTITNSSVTRGNILDGSNNLIASGEALSIDGSSDIDFFSFAVGSSQDVTIVASPEGFAYASGPQNNSNGDEPTIDYGAQTNLTITLYDTNGTSVLSTANASGIGSAETLVYSIATGGTYFVRISGDVDAAQMYQLDVSATAATPTTLSGTVFNDTDGDGNHDGGEAGLSGWTVFLDEDDDGVLDTAGTTNFASSDIPKAISAIGTPQVTSTLNVSGLSGVITDVNITLDITHTYNEDLDVFLIAPDGTRIELFTDVGGSSDNFTNTTLDDEAGTPITSGSAPFTGSFRPEGSLSVVDGFDPNGTWTLEVNDDFSADGGTLNSWSLEISTSGETSTTTDSNGDYSFLLGSGGAYTVAHVLQNPYVQTSPAGGYHDVFVTLGTPIANLDFGNRIPGSNTDPVANDDSGSTDEDTVLNVAAPGVLDNDTDDDGDSPFVSSFDATSAMGATVNVNADGSYSYDPTGAASLQALNDTESANDTFTYTIADGNGGFDTATVTVAVGGVDEPFVPFIAIIDDGDAGYSDTGTWGTGGARAQRGHALERRRERRGRGDVVVHRAHRGRVPRVGDVGGSREPRNRCAVHRARRLECAGDR